MNDLIEDITTCLQKCSSFENDFIQNLRGSKTIWKENYPIAIVHSKNRIKKTAYVKLLQENKLFDENGMTPQYYTDETLSLIKQRATELLQSVRFLALKEEPKKAIHYQEKRHNDFWKKIQDVHHIRSSLDYYLCAHEDDICKVEFELREIIRKRKEVHAFKEIGFIWMAITDRDISKLFTHYFKDNYVCVEKRYHIGWSNTLKEINMRDFVCPPR